MDPENKETNGIQDPQLAQICQRYPDYPAQAASVVRTAKLIARRIHDRANATLSAHGLSYPEYNLLMMLYGSADYRSTPSLLAQAAAEKSANITRLTDQLSRKGLIERTPSLTDRRKIEVTLLPAGLRLLEDTLPSTCRDLQELASQIDIKELQQLVTLQQRFLAVLDLHPSATAPSES